MLGDTAIAKILKAEGVEWMACFPNQPLIDVAAREGIRPVVARQERAGVNMAEGFSRTTSGKPVGVFCMQSGPGAENAYGGIAQAYANSGPILLLPGGPPRERIGVSPNFDSPSNFRGVTKYSVTINLVSRIPELMRMAFTQLNHGRPGPVLVEIPGDVAKEEFPDDAFHYEPVKTFRSGASQEDVRDLVSALLKASCPIINAGQGVLFAEATDELVEFAELTSIPVVATLAGKSAFPETHRLALGAAAGSYPLMVARFFQKTDFILGVGTSFSKSGFSATMPEDVTIAQITNNPEDINKDIAISFGAMGDAKIVLRQMVEEVKRQVGSKGRADVNGVADEIREIRGEWMEEWRPRLESDEVPINPYRIINELANAVDVANTIITHDSGYPREQLYPFWRPVTPGGYIGWGKSTQLGTGLGLAMGAKLAAPEKQVINVMGDAAFGMAGMDIETAVRSNIPILTVILYNGVMTGYDDHMPYASEHWDSDKLSGDYTKVAEALGAYAERVTAPDEIAGAIQRGIAANREGQTAVIEFVTKVEKTTSRYNQ